MKQFIESYCEHLTRRLLEEGDAASPWHELILFYLEHTIPHLYSAGAQLANLENAPCEEPCPSPRLILEEETTHPHMLRLFNCRIAAEELPSREPFPFHFLLEQIRREIRKAKAA
jgi:hypothetical protein